MPTNGQDTMHDAINGEKVDIENVQGDSKDPMGVPESNGDVSLPTKEDDANMVPAEPENDGTEADAPSAAVEPPASSGETAAGGAEPPNANKDEAISKEETTENSPEEETSEPPPKRSKVEDCKPTLEPIQPDGDNQSTNIPIADSDESKVNVAASDAENPSSATSETAAAATTVGVTSEEAHTSGVDSADVKSLSTEDPSAGAKQADGSAPNINTVEEESMKVDESVPDINTEEESGTLEVIESVPDSNTEEEVGTIKVDKSNPTCVADKSGAPPPTGSTDATASPDGNNIIPDKGLDTVEGSTENGPIDMETDPSGLPGSTDITPENGELKGDNVAMATEALESKAPNDQDDQKDNGTDQISKRSRKANLDPKMLEIRRKVHLGCRDNDFMSAIQAYEEALAEGIKVEAQTFYNLLNLCGGLEQRAHVGRSKESEEAVAKITKPETVDSKKRQEYAFSIKEQMAKLNIALNETAYTAVVKVLVLNKEFAKAEEILQESENVQQCKPKLRLYAPLLCAYCEERRMVDALKCWLRLTKQKLEISERESMCLLRCALATGDTTVFERVLSNVANDVPVPSKETVAAILEWFESAHAIHTNSIRVPKHADEGQVKELLDEIHKDEVEAPPNMGPVVNAKGWNVSSAVAIDCKTGILQGGCLKGCSLKPVSLSDRARDDMLEMNRNIVLQGKLEGSNLEFQGGRKGRIRDDFDVESRKRQWQNFEDYLQRKESLDVVVDAANVGYMNQSFNNAPKHVSYNQINWIVRHFVNLGKKVLLVLHERHFSKFLMPPEFRYLEAEWESMGILYKTPAGMNDDWFWLHAALKFRTLVVTNDEMRDHHFQMLSPRTFLRWKERHQIHFDFGDWVTAPLVEGKEGDTDKRNQRERKVELVYPAAYSRRVQRVEDGLVIPLIKRGDENRFLDGYHTAASDEPEEETYLCIQPIASEEATSGAQSQGIPPTL